jgi:hypothetical protein
MIKTNPNLYKLPESEIKQYGEQNLTYGSLTNKGIKTLINEIQKYVTNIYGLDLGCGDGELIYNFEQLISDSNWYGVEISGYRISLQTRNVNIWQGDMLLESFKPYNVLHADNLCLDDITIDKLEEKISIEFTGLYITYKYPQNIHFLKKATYIDTILTETTWIMHEIHLFII